MIYLKTYESFSQPYKKVNLNTYDFYNRYIKNFVTSNYKNLQKENSFEKEDFDEVLETLYRDCGEFIKELTEKKQYPLFRGSRYVDDTYIPGLYKKSSYPNRKNVDTNVYISELIDDKFKEKFGFRVRSENSIFASKDPYITNDYGYSYVFFPIGDYKYTYNPNITDLYSDIQSQNWYKSFVNTDDCYYELYGQIDSDGYWSKDGKEYDLYSDMKIDFPDLDYDLRDEYWEPSITIDEFIKNVDEEAKQEIESLVNDYKFGGLEDVMQQEIVFKCKEYYLVDIFYYQMLMEHFGLRAD